MVAVQRVGRPRALGVNGAVAREDEAVQLDLLIAHTLQKPLDSRTGHTLALRRARGKPAHTHGQTSRICSICSCQTSPLYSPAAKTQGTSTLHWQTYAGYVIIWPIWHAGGYDGGIFFERRLAAAR